MDYTGLVQHFKDLAFIWSGMGSDWKDQGRETIPSHLPWLREAKAAGLNGQGHCSDPCEGCTSWYQRGCSECLKKWWILVKVRFWIRHRV